MDGLDQLKKLLNDAKESATGWSEKEHGRWIIECEYNGGVPFLELIDCNEMEKGLLVGPCSTHEALEIFESDGQEVPPIIQIHFFGGYQQ